MRGEVTNDSSPTTIVLFYIYWGGHLLITPNPKYRQGLPGGLNSILKELKFLILQITVALTWRETDHIPVFRWEDQSTNQSKADGVRTQWMPALPFHVCLVTLAYHWSMNVLWWFFGVLLFVEMKSVQITVLSPQNPCPTRIWIWEEHLCGCPQVKIQTCQTLLQWVVSLQERNWGRDSGETSMWRKWRQRHWRFAAAS